MNARIVDMGEDLDDRLPNSQRGVLVVASGIATGFAVASGMMTSVYVELARQATYYGDAGFKIVGAALTGGAAAVAAVGAAKCVYHAVTGREESGEKGRSLTRRALYAIGGATATVFAVGTAMFASNAAELANKAEYVGDLVFKYIGVGGVALVSLAAAVGGGLCIYRAVRGNPRPSENIEVTDS